VSAEERPPRPPSGVEPGEQPAERPHDPAGLDLARSIARSLGRSAARRAGLGADSSAGTRRRGRRRAGEAKSSGAHPDDRDPQTLDATIGRLVAEHGWSTDVAVHGVFSRWHEIVGREVAEHCRPERYADTKLSVRADSTAWATQMRMLAPTVVRRLNEELGDGTVTVLDVLAPNLPTWTKGRRAVRDGRGPRDTYG
jgi:predicted nucleic acid-binding Zn ribbon protein